MSKTTTIKVAKRDLSVIEAELHTALKSGTMNKIKIGGLLVEAKATVKHGEWLRWLENHFALSERSAQHYMVASAVAAKNESVADLKFHLTGICALDKYDEETLAAVLRVAKTDWLNGEGVDRVAQEFRRSKDAKDEAGEHQAEKEAEERAETPPSEPAKAMVEKEAEARAEAETMVDALPPKLPAPAAPAALPRDASLTPIANGKSDEVRVDTNFPKLLHRVRQRIAAAKARVRSGTDTKSATPKLSMLEDFKMAVDVLLPMMDLETRQRAKSYVKEWGEVCESVALTPSSQ